MIRSWEICLKTQQTIEAWESLLQWAGGREWLALTAVPKKHVMPRVMRDTWHKICLYTLKQGVAWIDVERLAEQCHTSIRTMEKDLTWLTDHQFIIRQRLGRGWRSNTWLADGKHLYTPHWLVKLGCKRFKISWKDLPQFLRDCEDSNAVWNSIIGNLTEWLDFSGFKIPKHEFRRTCSKQFQAKRRSYQLKSHRESVAAWRLRNSKVKTGKENTSCSKFEPPEAAHHNSNANIPEPKEMIEDTCYSKPCGDGKSKRPPSGDFQPSVEGIDQRVDAKTREDNEVVVMTEKQSSNEADRQNEPVPTAESNSPRCAFGDVPQGDRPAESIVGAPVPIENSSEEPLRGDPPRNGMVQPHIDGHVQSSSVKRESAATPYVHSEKERNEHMSMAKDVPLPPCRVGYDVPEYHQYITNWHLYGRMVTNAQLELERRGHGLGTAQQATTLPAPLQTPTPVPVQPVAPVSNLQMPATVKKPDNLKGQVLVSGGSVQGFGDPPTSSSSLRKKNPSANRDPHNWSARDVVLYWSARMSEVFPQAPRLGTDMKMLGAVKRKLQRIDEIYHAKELVKGVIDFVMFQWSEVVRPLKWENKDYPKNTMLMSDDLFMMVLEQFVFRFTNEPRWTEADFRMAFPGRDPLPKL